MYDQQTTREQAIPEGSFATGDFAEEFEVVDKASNDRLSELAFMEEAVEIEVSQTDNPYAEALIHLECNGVTQIVVRGVPQYIKRKFVEILARSKTENIATPEIIDAKGNKTAAIRRFQGLRYPFRVLHDSNPNGHSWLDGIMKQGA